MARVGPQRHRKKKSSYSVLLTLIFKNQILRSRISHNIIQIKKFTNISKLRSHYIKSHAFIIRISTIHTANPELTGLNFERSG